MKRYLTIKVRVSEDDLARLACLADASHDTRSSIVRQLISEAWHEQWAIVRSKAPDVTFADMCAAWDRVL